MKFLAGQLALLGACGTAAAFSLAPAGLHRLSHRGLPSSTTALSVSGGRLRVRPVGIGAAVPSTVVTNVDLESVHDTSDEWIRTRTGIGERRVLVHGGTVPVKSAEGAEDGGEEEEPETLRTLGIAAAKDALAMAGVDPLDVELVVCATSSPDDLFGDAPSVAHAVGCSTETAAFDLTAACSGFLFGLVTAGRFLEGGDDAGKERHALVLGADALARWVDWDDRNSCILFGDGAGAVVLSTGGEEGEDDDDGGCGVLGFAMHSNGGGYKDLKCIYRGEPKEISTPGAGTVVQDGSYDLMSMNGRKVYSFATREVPKVIQEALDRAGMSVDEVDHLLLHQANIRIMEVVADRLGLPMDKVLTNLHRYGNTSAASIPLALNEAVREGKVKKGDVIACAGFGAGLSWGAAILRWG